jgi:hypothetical protein
VTGARVTLTRITETDDQDAVARLALVAVAATAKQGQ